MFLIYFYDKHKEELTCQFDRYRDIKIQDCQIKYSSQDDSLIYIAKYSTYFNQDLLYSFKVSSNFQEYEALEHDYERILLFTLIGKAEADIFTKDKNFYLNVFKNPSNIVSSFLSSTSLNELISKARLREDFNSFQIEALNNEQRFLNLSSSYSSRKAAIELYFNKNKYNSDSIEIKQKIGIDKPYIIKNIQTFLDQYDNEETVKFGKNLNIKLCDSNLNEQAILAIPYLKKFNFNYFKSAKIALYKNSTAIDLINIYKGSKIFFNDLLFNVSNDTIEASVFYSEKGDIKYEPYFKQPISNYIQSANRLVVFFNENRECITLNFENEAQARIYSLAINSNYDLSIIKNIISPEFNTFLEKAIRPKFISKNDSKLTINLYISLDMQKTIIFKTDYLIENQLINRENINNKFYKSLILEYKIRLQELGFKENGKEKDLEILNTLLQSDFSRIKELANVYLSDEILGMKRRKLSGISVAAKSNKNWLELQICSQDYSTEELKKILAAYKKKKKFILLKNNFISLDNKDVLDELIQFEDSLNISDYNSNTQVPFYEVFKLASYSDSKNIQINFDEQIKNIITNIKNFKNIEIAIDERLKKILRPYQIEAVKWLYTLSSESLSGVLADDMGLGKTLEFISFRTLIKENSPTLIVCPKSLIYNWKAEFNKRDPESKCHIIDGSKQVRIKELESSNNTKDIVIVSYDSLRSDLDEFKKIHFSIICLDEAQYIKNSFAKKTQAVKQLDATSRFALTGTPIENALTDLWSIFDFLMPNYLLSETNFNKEYSNAFDEGNDDAKNKLLAKITPFILRRTKKDVLNDLPPKTVEIVNILMSEKQSELYNAYIQNTKQSMNEDPTNKIAILAALTRLRQICVDPSMFIENYNELSSKLEYTIDLINNCINNSHKVIVFSQFTSVLEHLQKLLLSQNIKPLYICGDTKAVERIEISNKFNENEDQKVILISLKAGGTGLNLYGADTVIHLDPWWNFAVEDQATDRAHRLGQKKPVTVYKLVAHDSIEEKVINLQESKRTLYEEVIRNGTENITSLSDDEIKYLLS